MKVTIVNYGLSNLLSVQHAFAHLGAETLTTGDAQDILRADALVLPGVGAFRDGMAGLARLGLVEPLRQKAQSGTPLLGICLGMQMLLVRGVRALRRAGADSGAGGSPARHCRRRHTAARAARQLGPAAARRGTHGFFRNAPGAAAPRRGMLFYP